jgi:predicted CXXCH cytochrome family protein
MKNYLKNSVIVLSIVFLFILNSTAQENSQCFDCHSDKTLTKDSGGMTHSVFVEEKKFSTSVHGTLLCIDCHADLAGKEIPHEENLNKVNCGICHTNQQGMYSEGLHGKAAARGDKLAPTCTNCHGKHDIALVKDPLSAVSPMKIPFLCGKCHQEGAPVQKERVIHQDHILENYSESIHGEGLLKKGLVVSATCISCHSSHRILPHTDSRSTIARKNIANTCMQCHTQIEQVHRKVIKGELWEKEAHVLPACVDCHQPHKARKVFYDQGMSDRDCLSCHQKEDIRASNDGRSLFVNQANLTTSVHVKTACSQCHSDVSPSLQRPCTSIKQKVNCSACHTAVVEEYQKSTHGTLFAKNDPNAPTCTECHTTHTIRNRNDPKSPTFPLNVPNLCAKCHREGEKAAVRYRGPDHEIISEYSESIHGKGLLKSGLVVTAMCTDCHTAHKELPHVNGESSVNEKNIPKTCGKCHHGIEEKFVQSVHSKSVTKTDKELPVCNDCHTAHKIRRTDADGFKLDIMEKCGRCHEQIAKTYFDTYHGKVSQLGYTKTAKCYDCHGSHDILPITDNRSHLSRQNVLRTCQKCHPGATRRFAGYLTHATHHDPAKYPFLFWTFWGMTALLIVTFVGGGLHTILWLPRALKEKRKYLRQQAHEQEESSTKDDE